MSGATMSASSPAPQLSEISSDSDLQYPVAFKRKKTAAESPLIPVIILFKKGKNFFSLTKF